MTLKPPDGGFVYNSDDRATATILALVAQPDRAQTF